jgi:hypothetical protein
MIELMLSKNNLFDLSFSVLHGKQEILISLVWLASSYYFYVKFVIYTGKKKKEEKYDVVIMAQ